MCEEGGEKVEGGGEADGKETEEGTSQEAEKEEAVEGEGKETTSEVCIAVVLWAEPLASPCLL